MRFESTHFFILTRTIPCIYSYVNQRERDRGLFLAASRNRFYRTAVPLKRVRDAIMPFFTIKKISRTLNAKTASELEKKSIDKV